MNRTVELYYTLAATIMSLHEEVEDYDTTYDLIKTATSLAIPDDENHSKRGLQLFDITDRAHEIMEQVRMSTD